MAFSRINSTILLSGTGKEFKKNVSELWRGVLFFRRVEFGALMYAVFLLSYCFREVVISCQLELNEGRPATRIPTDWNFFYQALEKGPENCSNEERDAVRFFMVVPLLSRADPARKNFPLWKVFTKKRWHLSFALAATLYTRFSDSGNIVANIDSDSSGSDRKVKRRKCCPTNAVIRDAAEEYIQFCGIFRALRKSDGAEELFNRWDEVIGHTHCGDNRRDVAKRPSIQPAVKAGVMYDPSAWECSSDEDEEEDGVMSNVAEGSVIGL